MDSRIDPTNRDYVLINGTPQRDPADGLANACYLRLETPLGSYWADKTLGSRLHELQREKDLSRVAMLAKQYAEQALAPILADGRATQINVSTERMPGRLNLLIEVLAASGETLTFKHPVQVV
jgi:phage gp46-like protein